MVFGAFKGFFIKNYKILTVLFILIVVILLIYFKQTKEDFAVPIGPPAAKPNILCEAPAPRLPKPKVPLPNILRCMSENPLIGNVHSGPNSGVEMFIYSYDADTAFYNNTHQTATYLGRIIKSELPKMKANNPKLLAQYMNNYPLAIMTRAIHKYSGDKRSGYIDVVSPDGFVIKMENAVMLQNWPPNNQSSIHSSLCFNIGSNYHIYTEMFFYLTKVPQIDLSINVRDSSGYIPFKDSLVTRVKKGMPIVGWDFYTGNKDDRNGIVTSRMNTASGQMDFGSHNGKKCLQFNGNNGWVKTTNRLSGGAFKSFTTMFYYTALSNNATCKGAFSNRLFSLSNGTDLSSDYTTNNKANIAIEGGILEKGIPFIRLKSTETQTTITVKGTSPLPINLWTHFAAVFSNDFTVASLYINGVLVGSKTNVTFDGNFYNTMIFAYGSLGHAPGPFTADDSANPFLGGIAWAHWFDYPLCVDDVNTDYNGLFCDTSVYSEPTNTGWPVICSQVAIPSTLDKKCIATVNIPGPTIPSIPGITVKPLGPPECTEIEGSSSECKVECVNSGQFAILNGANSNVPWQSIAVSNNGLVGIACGYEDNLYTLNNGKWQPKSWSDTSLGTARWLSVACNGTGGIMVAVVEDKDIYLSKDMGSSWNQMTVEPVGGIGGWNCVTCSADASNPIIIAVGVQGIFKSTTTGLSWSLKGPSGYVWLNIGSSKDGNTHIAIGTEIDNAQNTLYYSFYSTDAGDTWNKSVINGVNNRAQINCVTVSENGNLAFMAIADDYVYASTNKGATWANTDIANLPECATGTCSLSIPRGNWQWITGSKDLKTVMVCATPGNINGNSYSGNIFVSLNYGQTFIPTNVQTIDNGQYIYWQCMTASSSGDYFYAVDSNSGGIYRSTCCDPSQFWMSSKSYANVKFSSVALGDNNKCIACDKGGKLYLGSNYGANWSVITDSNLPATGLWKNVSCSADGTIMFALEMNGDVYYSVTSGQAWQKTNLEKGQWSYCAISDNINNMCTVAIVDYRGYIQIGSLSGSNITFKTATVDNKPWCSIAISSSGSSMVAVASNGFGIVTSTDRGQTWKHTCAPYSMWQGVVSDSTGTKILAIQYGAGIWYSNNGGASWKQTSAPTHKWASICGSKDLCKIIAVADNCNVYMSFDFGVTWITSNSRISNWTAVTCTSTGINAIAVDSNGHIATTATIQTCMNPNYIAGTYMPAPP